MKELPKKEAIPTPESFGKAVNDANWERIRKEAQNSATADVGSPSTPEGGPLTQASFAECGTIGFRTETETAYIFHDNGNGTYTFRRIPSPGDNSEPVEKIIPASMVSHRTVTCGEIFVYGEENGGRTPKTSRVTSIDEKYSKRRV